MKRTLNLPALALSLLLSTALQSGLAQRAPQAFVMRDEDFAYVIRVFNPVFPSETILSINQYRAAPGETINPAGSLKKVAYSFTGVGANGVLHVLEATHDYALDIRQEVPLAFTLDGSPIIFPRPSSQLKEDLRLSLEVGADDALRVHLLNELEAFEGQPGPSAP